MHLFQAIRRGQGRVAPPKRLGSSGFTLIELLTVMAILSLISASLYTTFSNALGLRMRCRNELGRLQADREFVAVLRRDLGNLSGTTPNLMIRSNGIALLRKPARSGDGPYALNLVRYHWIPETAEKESEVDQSVRVGGPTPGWAFTREETPLSLRLFTHWTPEALLEACVAGDSLAVGILPRAAHEGSHQSLLETPYDTETRLQVFGNIRRFSVSQLMPGRTSVYDSLVVLRLQWSSDGGWTNPPRMAPDEPDAGRSESASLEAQDSTTRADSILGSQVDPTLSTVTLSVPAARSFAKPDASDPVSEAFPRLGVPDRGQEAP